MSLFTARRTQTAAALFAVPALLFAFTACAASGSGDDGSTSTSGSDSAESKHNAWRLKFEQCLRDNGVDVADTTGDGSAQVSSQTSAAGGQTDLAAISAACEKKVGTPPPLSPEQEKPGQQKLEAESMKAMLKAAKCFRESGFDVPDPKPREALSIPGEIPQAVVDKCSGGGFTITSPAQ